VLTNNQGFLYVAAGLYSGSNNLNLSTSSTYANIIGAGSGTTTIDCGNQGSGFDFFSGTFFVSGFTIQNCRRLRTNNISSDCADGSGGGIRVQSAFLNVQDLAFNNNYAGNNGGAVFVTSLTLNVSNCSVQNNQANNSGGGVYLSSGTLLLYGDSAVQSNKAGNAGNDVYCTNGAIVINGNVILNNIPEIICQGCSVSINGKPTQTKCSAFGSFVSISLLIASILLYLF